MRNFQHAEHSFQYARWLLSFPRASPNSIFILPSLRFSIYTSNGSIFGDFSRFHAIYSGQSSMKRDAENWNEHTTANRTYVHARFVCESKIKNPSSILAFLLLTYIGNFCGRIMAYAVARVSVRRNSVWSTQIKMLGKELKISIFDVARATSSNAIPQR